MIQRKMVNPILRILKHSTAFAKKVQNQESQTETGEWILRTEDEIEVLAHGVSAMMRDMLSYIGSIESFNQMQELAKSIQSSILPDRIPAFPGRTEFDIYAVRHFIHPVGSVFYDYFMLDGVRLGVMAAKIHGNGIAAALFMMMTRTLLKNFAHLGMEPAKVLCTANDELCESNDAGITVSVVFGILDTVTGTFEYANAGEAFLYRAATYSHSAINEREATQKATSQTDSSPCIEKIDVPEGFLLGTQKGISFSQHTLHLQKNECFLLSTGIEDDRFIKESIRADPLQEEERTRWQKRIDNTREDGAVVILHYYV
jgi:serine phosphatase RsbU (regulator of sigma subunit)